MLRVLIVCALLTCAASGAHAETLAERGAYLVNTILACGNCHTPRTVDGSPIAERALSGGVTITTPVFVATASNITPDPETGIGTWSDDDIKRALLQGIRPKHGPLAGVPLAAVMPINFYKALLPRDLDAIVAYVRSVKPVRHEVAAPSYKAPPQRRPYPDAELGFTEAAFADPINRGKYLVTIGHCMECHSAWSRGISDYTTGLGQGGRRFGPALVQGLSETWKGAVAPNITSDPTAGLGAWSDDEIKRAIRQGIARDGRQLHPPMPFNFYAGMTDRDVGDVVAYLRTIPPLK